MKRRSRTRRVLKWAGAILCLVISFGFVFSSRRAAMWTSPGLRCEISLMLGTINYAWRPEGWRLENERYPPRPGWGIARYGGLYPLSWWIVGAGNKSWQNVGVPLWIPFVVFAIPSAILWHQDRRNVAEALRRLSVWLTPRRPKKVTFWRVALFCVLHVIVLFVGLATFEGTYSFFVDYRPGDPVYPVLDRAVLILLWPTPLWGILWAWAWTRLLNWLFRRQPGHRCLACGYDLTGNVSGRCPECGRSVVAKDA